MRSARGEGKLGAEVGREVPLHEEGNSPIGSEQEEKEKFSNDN